MAEEMRAPSDVVLGIPHIGSDLPVYFMESVFQLKLAGGARIIRVQGKPIAIARERIVQSFMDETDATHLFFMDADMAFPPGVVTRLLERDLPIVSGVYFARAGVPVPHFYRFDHVENPDGTCPVGKDHTESRANGRWYRPLGNELTRFLLEHPEPLAPVGVTPLYENSLVDCDAVGGGCLLISREVFETIERPWFESLDDGGAEDFYFCEKAKAAGISVTTDLTVMCAHEFRPRFITHEDFVFNFKIGTDKAWDFEDDDLILDVGVQAGGRPGHIEWRDTYRGTATSTVTPQALAEGLRDLVATQGGKDGH